MYYPDNAGGLGEELVRLPNGQVVPASVARHIQGPWQTMPINTAGTPVSPDAPTGGPEKVSITPVGYPNNPIGGTPSFDRDAYFRSIGDRYAGGILEQYPLEPKAAPKTTENMPTPPADAPVSDKGMSIFDLLGAQKNAKPAMNQSDVMMAIGSGMLGLSGDANLQKLGMAGFGQVEERSKERKLQGTRNATAEYFRKNGRDDIADAMASGLLDAKDAFKLIAGTDAQSTIGKLAADLKAGRISRAEYDVAVQGIKDGGINIAVGSGDKWTEGVNKYLIESYGGLADQGRNSGRSLIAVQQLESALANAPQGTWGGIVGWAQNSLGLSLDDNASDAQVAQAIINQLVPQQRQAGSGPMSDSDLLLFQRSLPTLLGSPEGNAKIIRTLREIAQYDIAMGDIARRVIIDPQYTPEMGDADMRKLQNPLQWVKDDSPEERRKQFKVL